MPALGSGFICSVLEMGNGRYSDSSWSSEECESSAASRFSDVVETAPSLDLRAFFEGGMVALASAFMVSAVIGAGELASS